MLHFIGKRILSTIPVLVAISLVSFIIIQLPPGDFATTYKSYLMNYAHMPETEATRAANQYRAMYGLDKPMPVQYLNWVKGIVTQWKFGYSFSYKKDVGELFKERLPRTLILALSAHLISTLVGVGIGIYSATHQYSMTDNLLTVFAFLCTAVPRFFMAIVMLYGLMFWAGIPDMGGWVSPAFSMAPPSWAKFVNVLGHVWPIIAIAGLGGIAQNFRVMRGNLLDVLHAQYVTTARSKGLTEGAVILKHAVPNALHPLIMYQGMVLPYMLQGELEAAIVLSIPTLAPLFYSSLLNQDVYVAGGCLMIYALMLVAGNLAADIALALVDPRIRLS